MVLALSGTALGQITVVSGASFEELRPLAPGSIATAFGAFDGATPATAGGQMLPTQLGGVDVTVDGLPAALYAVTTTQVNFQVPLGVRAGIDKRTATAEFRVGGVLVGRGGVLLRDVSPALFTRDANDPLRPAVALNRDGSVNSADNAAQLGEVLELFSTGQGAKLISPLEIFPPRTSVEPLVFFRTWKGETLAAELPVPGLWRIRVRVPEVEQLDDGPTPIVVAIDGVSSNTVSVWIGR